MARKGLVRAGAMLVKVLGDGELGKKLEVHAHKFSGAARAGIEKAGGSCQVVSS
jgi:large subunit ribosomal protein L15